jgi:hypothetical protein
VSNTTCKYYCNLGMCLYRQFRLGEEPFLGSSCIYSSHDVGVTFDCRPFVCNTDEVLHPNTLIGLEDNTVSTLKTNSAYHSVFGFFKLLALPLEAACFYA